MNKLRKVITFFLILVITFPGETAHAFSFVPEFISHYKHHNEEHHQLSFKDFVFEHINGVHDETDAQHEQDHCPLTHDHVSTSLNLFIFKTIVPIEINENTGALDERLSLFPAYQFCTSEFNSSIWQPPKIS